MTDVFHQLGAVINTQEMLQRREETPLIFLFLPPARRPASFWCLCSFRNCVYTIWICPPVSARLTNGDCRAFDSKWGRADAAFGSLWRQLFTNAFYYCQCQVLTAFDNNLSYVQVSVVIWFDAVSHLSRAVFIFLFFIKWSCKLSSSSLITLIMIINRYMYSTLTVCVQLLC